jgi:hypothetical protein
VLAELPGARKLVATHGERDGVRSVGLGIVGEVKDGVPIPENAEIGRATDMGDGILKLERASHVGPARVSSAAYRSGWDKIKWN